MKNKDQIALSLQVLKQFRLIYGSAKRQFKHVEDECGISGSQLWLLQEIANTPTIGIFELAKKLSIHPSTCSLLVEKLKTKKLVVKLRSEIDQRRVGLKISTSGEKALSKAPGPAEGVLPVALQQLPEVELKRLHSSMGRLIQNLHILDESAADKPLADL